MLEEYLQVTLSGLTGYKQSREQLTVVFQHILLRAASSLLVFEESHLVFLYWFVERPHALSECLELLLASLLMGPNQFSRGWICNILCV